MVAAKGTDNVTRAIALATAPAWRPEAGDRITGTLATVRKQDGGEFGPYPVFVFDTPNGVTAVHAFHQTLIDGLKDIAAQIGDEITIAYVDKRETNASKKDGKSGTADEIDYHLYVVMAGDGSDALSTEAYDWQSEA